MGVETRNPGETEIDIQEIFGVLRSWWLRIVALVILFAALGFGYTKCTYVPVYTATGLIIVNNPYVKVGDSSVVVREYMTSRYLVDTYAVIMTSRQVADLILADLNLDIHHSKISSSISIELTETEVMKVSVKWGDPVLAANIVNSLMRVAPPTISETVGLGTIKVVDYAEVPTRPAPPKYQLNIAIGGLLGGLIGCGLAFALHFLNTTLKNDSEVRSSLGIPLFGRVPRAAMPRKRHSGNTPLIISDPILPGFKEAYKFIRTNLEYACKNLHAKAIVITSALEKEGKSTVAVNTALALIQAGKSVILLDCDLRRPAIAAKLKLQTYPNRSLASVLRGELALEEAVTEVVGTKLHVLVSPRPEENPSELLGTQVMADLIRVLKTRYDYVILDTPPAHLVTDTAVLCAYADGILFVIKQGLAKFSLLSTVIEDLSKLDAPILGCVFNNIDYKRAGGYYKHFYYDLYYNDYYHKDGTGG